MDVCFIMRTKCEECPKDHFDVKVTLLKLGCSLSCINNNTSGVQGWFLKKSLISGAQRLNVTMETTMGVIIINIIMSEHPSLYCISACTLPLG